MGDVIVARVQATDKAAEGVVVIQLILLGINQADISKLENGTRNPSLKLLKRLADGMGMDLKLVFTPKEPQNLKLAK